MGKWENGKSFIDFHWALRCNNLHACLCMSDYTSYTCTPILLLFSVALSFAVHSLNFMPKQWHAINLNGFALRLKQNAFTNPRNVFSAPEACVWERGWRVSVVQRCRQGCQSTLYAMNPLTTYCPSLPTHTPFQHQFGCGKHFKVLHFVPFFHFIYTQVFVNTRNICNV